MSHTPKRKVPVRSVPPAPVSRPAISEDDYEEDYAPPAQSARSARKPAPRSPSAYQARPRNARDTAQPRSAPPKRDVFPYVMGAVTGALVVGLMAIAYLLGTSADRNSVGSVPASANPAGGSGANSAPTQPAAPAAAEPPRMPIAEFKALYDNPAKRPLIIDVRTKDLYDQSHIKGAISFPQEDVDTRVSELPKDKLIIAYCQ